MAAEVTFTQTSQLLHIVAGLSLLQDAIDQFLRDSTDAEIEDELGVTREDQAEELLEVIQLKTHFQNLVDAMQIFERTNIVYQYDESGNSTDISN